MTQSTRQSTFRLSVRPSYSILSEALQARAGRRFAIPSDLFLARVLQFIISAQNAVCCAATPCGLL